MITPWNNKSVFFFFSLFFFLGFFASTALAFEDYSLSVDGSVDAFVPACDSLVETMILQNTGSDAANIILELKSDAAKKVVQISPTQVFLSPNQQASIVAFITAPCKLDKTFDYTIVATSDTQTKEFARTLTIQPVNNIAAIVANSQLKGCPCEQQITTYSLTNIGSYPETYTVTSSSELVSVSPASIYLGPGETTTGSILASAQCSTYGLFPVNIEFEATSSGFTASAPITYTIDACYQYQLSIAKHSAQVCEQSYDLINVTVNNTAKIGNEYYLEIDGPEFTSLKGNYLQLNPGQLGQTQIEIAPPKKSAGKYTITVDSKTGIGNLVAQDSIDLSVISCYNYSIASAYREYQVCPQQHTIPLTLTNNGKFNETILLTTSDSAIAKISNTSPVLAPGQSTTMNVQIDGKNIGTYQPKTVRVTSTLKSNPAVAQQLALTLYPRTADDCYRLYVEPLSIDINNSNMTIDVSILNQGLVEGNYNITFDGTSWMSAKPTLLHLQPLQKGNITILSRAPVFADNISYTTYLTADRDGYKQTAKVVFNLNKQPSAISFIVMNIILSIILILIIVILCIWASKIKKYDKEQKVFQPQKIEKTFIRKTRPQKVAPIPKPIKMLDAGAPSKTPRINMYYFILGAVIFLFIALGMFLASYVIYVLLSPASNGTDINDHNLTANITNNTSGNTTNITRVNITNQTKTNVTTNQTNVTGTSNTTNITNTNNETAPPNTKSPREMALDQAYALIDYYNLTYENGSIIYSIVPENGNRIYNLTEKFVNESNLTYTYTPVNASFLNATIDKNMLTITPALSFVGVQTYTITATNMFNQSTTSPILTAIVVPEPQYGSQAYIVAGILLLIIISIIVYFDIKMMKKQYKAIVRANKRR